MEWQVHTWYMTCVRTSHVPSKVCIHVHSKSTRRSRKACKLQHPATTALSLVGLTNPRQKFQHHLLTLLQNLLQHDNSPVSNAAAVSDQLSITRPVQSKTVRSLTAHIHILSKENSITPPPPTFVPGKTNFIPFLGRSLASLFFALLPT